MSSELHAQASLWRHPGHQRTAALVLEGRAHDRATGGIAVDALHRVVLARGLRLTTDLALRDPRPTPGWRLRVDDDRAFTLDWPRFRPLLDRVPLDLPAGWLRTAVTDGRIDLFVAYGLDLHEPARTADLLPCLERAARNGAVASGVLTLHCTATLDAVALPRPRGAAEAEAADRLVARSLARA